MTNLGCGVLYWALVALFLPAGDGERAFINLTPVYWNANGEPYNQAANPGSGYDENDISGNTLTVRGGGFRAFFHVEAGGWDSTMGAGALARSVSARIDSKTFRGTNAVPVNEGCDILQFSDPEVEIPCANTGVCIAEFNSVGPPKCGDAIPGICNWGWINTSKEPHADGKQWIHSNIYGGYTADWGLTSPSGPLCFSSSEPSEPRPDDKHPAPYYIGTLALWVPECAMGTYTLDFVADETFLADASNHMFPDIGIPIDFGPAVVKILCDSDADCADDNACTADVCEAGECLNTPDCVSGDDCDDGDACTIDLCTAEGCCENVPECETDEDCGTGGCPIPRCTAAGCCVYVRECRANADCDDANLCTLDSCDVEGCCEHMPDCRFNIECNDFNICTTDTCTVEGCCMNVLECTSDIDCDDGSDCTIDICTPSGCCEHQLPPDSDGDGVGDTCDVCPNTPSGTGVDGDGRPLGDMDEDCDTDLEDYHLFLNTADPTGFLLLYEGLTGPLP